MILFKTIKKSYVNTWHDYSKTSSYKTGGRWNSSGIAAMYTSTNPQNAMLELGNYCSSPKMADKLYRLVVFEVKELRLFDVDVTQLPHNWQRHPHASICSTLGDSILNNSKYDGLRVPSATINSDVATHPINAVRQAAYANVVINLNHVGTENIKILGEYSPIFATQMFTKN